MEEWGGAKLVCMKMSPPKNTNYKIKSTDGSSEQSSRRRESGDNNVKIISNKPKITTEGKKQIVRNCPNAASRPFFWETDFNRFPENLLLVVGRRGRRWHGDLSPQNPSFQGAE